MERADVAMPMQFCTAVMVTETSDAWFLTCLSYAGRQLWPIQKKVAFQILSRITKGNFYPYLCLFVFSLIVLKLPLSDLIA